MQIRLQGFDLVALTAAEAKVRNLFATDSSASARVTARVDDVYFADLAHSVSGRLGGKVGVAPRLYPRGLIADVLDRVDQFPDFDPRRHYAPTINEREMSAAERAAAGAASVDDVELDV